MADELTRLMPRHPLLKVPLHSLHRLTIQRNMITIHSENLTPAFSACGFQGEIDVREGLIDLSVDFFVEDVVFGVPAAWGGVLMPQRLGGVYDA